MVVLTGSLNEPLRNPVARQRKVTILRAERHGADAMDSLGEALPREMARVRDHVLPHYDELGPVGVFGAAMIRQDLDAAAKAIAEGDMVAMVQSYQALKETDA